MLNEPVDEELLLSGLEVRIADQEHIPVLVQDIIDCLYRVGEEILRDVRLHHSDEVSAPPFQVAGKGVGDIVQLTDRQVDFGGGDWIDAAGVLEVAGYRADGYSGPVGHIDNGYLRRHKITVQPLQ